MSNKYTEDMTGTGRFIELPEQDDDPEPERYYDWMLWKLRKLNEKKWKKLFTKLKNCSIIDL